MKRLNSIIWGIVLVAAGVIFALNALELTDINLFFDGWWTLFIIIPCFTGIFTTHERLGNFLGFLVGVALFLACNDIFSFSLIWKLFIPAVIVLVGLKLIFKDAFPFRSGKTKVPPLTDGETLPEYCATFSGQNIDMSAQVFSGAEMTAVFGGIELDLRRAIITKDVSVKLCAIFGGIDILLPENINVKISSTSVFGGISNKRNQKNIADAPTVYISGSCIFGGADIK